jgi:hypothetical protein
MFCHCRACQRRTGAVVHSGAFFLRSRVRVKGESKIYGRGGASGFEIRFHFCPNCGSNVYWESDRTPDYYGITVGSFADPGFPAPTFSVWEESIHGWLSLPSVSEHFATGLSNTPDEAERLARPTPATK